MRDLILFFGQRQQKEVLVLQDDDVTRIASWASALFKIPTPNASLRSPQKVPVPRVVLVIIVAAAAALGYRYYDQMRGAEWEVSPQQIADAKAKGQMGLETSPGTVAVLPIPAKPLISCRSSGDWPGSLPALPLGRQHAAVVLWADRVSDRRLYELRLPYRASRRR